MRRAAGLALLLGLAPAALPAQRSLAIEQFHADIRVERDGSLLVSETITARFTGQWNGLYRTIPVKYRTPQGFSWTIGLDLQTVTDGSGEALRTESSRERHYRKIKIWVPGAHDAVRTVVLRYRVTNGLRFFEEHDELYWNITGDEWDVPLGHVSATITLPDGARGIRAIAFNGAYGSTAQDAVIDTSGTTIAIRMPTPLGFREGLTAVIGWDKGLVSEPTTLDRTAGFLEANWPLAIPVPVFLLAFAAWRRKGKDPEPRPVAVRYEPLEGLTPAEAGTLMDNTADLRDITATLVDLAVRGFLRIEERDDRKLMGLIGELEYVLHLAKPRTEWHQLAPHERSLLEGVFGGRGDTVEMSDLEDEFYTKLPGIRKDIFHRLQHQHRFYLARPDTVRGWWTAGALLLGLGIGVGGSLAADGLMMTPVPFVVAGVLTGLIMLGFAGIMPARTMAGARALEHVQGFEEFLRRVEAEHMERIIRHPELFDRYLPWAMAFRVEKKWAKAFEGIYTEPPSWYSGPSVTRFSAGRFSTQLSGMTAKAGSAMSSSPRSSGGSGFGGGGSSGGGGGGGGGGGF